MKWSIRQRILVSYTVLVVLVAAVGLYAYSGLANITRQEADLKNSLLPSLSSITKIVTTWEQNYALTQKLAAQQDGKASAAVTAALAENRKTLQDLLAKYEATGLAALDQDLFASLMVVQTSYYDQQDRLIELLRTSSIPEDGSAATPSDAAPALLRLLDNNFDSLRRAAQGLVYAREYKAEKSIEESIAISTHAMQMLAIGLAIVLLAGVLSGFLLLRAVKRPLAGLVETMDKMRQGDFTQRISRQDEFGALGEGFNRMADELSGLFGQVQKSGIQVGSSVTQIAATAKQQQSTASEIAVTTTQIGATSKEISATAKELVRTMNDVAVVAEETAGVAASGQTGLARMEETMSHVMDAAGSINDKLGILNEKAGNINQVVTTITKVADQTNLLSLNAAIEAEKAGEYGRGFAVVASEIRRLADQTAVATYDIEQMVREIQSAVSAGVMGMDKFSDQVRRGMDDVREVGGQLTQIIRQVQALVPRIESANEGMHAQATGAEQITEALMQLTEAAQQTVESLRQSNSAIDDLNRVSSDLRSGVARFKLDAAA